MGITRQALHEDVFAVFERACREREFEVAEHLLTALEVIARRRGDEEHLALAYLVFANACRALDERQD